MRYFAFGEHAMEKKNILWNLLISKTDQKNISRLARRLKIKSKSEAVRRAVVMALENTEPAQLPKIQCQESSLIIEEEK